MKRIVIISALMLTFSIMAGAQAQRNIERIIARSQALEGASVAVMAMTASGDTLVNYDGGRMLVPASTMKLVTTGTALHRLGPDFRFITRIGTTGPVEDGILKGDLVIIGGGDPTLCSSDTLAKPFFPIVKKSLDKAGIKEIQGRICGDGSYFGGAREHQCWEWEDIGTYYGSGMSGLSFAKNELGIKVVPGQNPGDSLIVKQAFPKTPWLDIEYDCLTGEKGTGDLLYMYTSDFSAKAVVRGTFAQGKNAKTVRFANKYPEYTFVHELKENLASGGIATNGIWASPCPFGETYDIQEVTEIGHLDSPKLADIARETNYDSDNFYAESIFRVLGKALGGDGSYESGAAAVSEVLRSLGLSGKGFKGCDGSGLSRTNLASPSFFCHFLNAMEKSTAFESFLESIPQAGRDGTVKYRLMKLLPEQRDRIRMKSGSMGGVYCFSGYILPQEGSGEIVTFSVMTNNFTCSSGTVTSIIDEIIGAIAASL